MAIGTGTRGATRQEHDTMGTLEVPADALYGAQTARAVDNFPISGIHNHSALVRAQAAIKIAAAQANRDLGLLDAQKAEAIVLAGKEVYEGQWAEHFVVDVFQAGAGTSFNMNVNEVIANRASEILGGQRGESRLIHPNDHVNMGQSTNDTIPTCMRLSALFLLPGLLEQMDQFHASLKRKAQEFDGVVKSGRTHLQDAVPIRLGQEFGGYVQNVRLWQERLARAGDSLRELGIGGSAVGTGLNTHPQYRFKVVENLSKLTGLELSASDNLFEAMQSMRPFAEVSSAVKNFCVDLIRICNDLRLLASGPRTGFNEIQLPPVQPGSSIMPGKVNPVMCEMTNMVCFHILGNDLCVTMAAQAGQMELNVMMPIIAYNLLQALEVLTNALRVLRVKCIDGIVANPDICRQYAESSLAMATVLAPYIGYERAAALAKESQKTGKSLPQLMEADPAFTKEQREKILSLESLTQPTMDSVGSAGG